MVAALEFSHGAYFLHGVKILLIILRNLFLINYNYWRYEGVLLEFVKFLLEINILVLELLKLLLE